MGKVSSRAEIRQRLHSALAQGKGLLAGAPGSGLNAKISELGGIDLLMVLHTGLMRQRGLPSIAQPEKPTNEIVKEMFQDQFRVTSQVPILAGIDVGQFPAGVVNFMSAGEIGSSEFVKLAEQNKGTDPMADLQFRGEMEMFEQCRQKERCGVGFAREAEMIRCCNARDIFSMTYVFTPEQAAQMAQAGADAIVAHCGGTAGGTVGHRAVLGYADAAKRLQDMFDAARAVNPDIFLFGHGGPFADPEDVAEMYRLCGAQGFVAGSGIDRLPIERAIVAAVEQFRCARRA